MRNEYDLPRPDATAFIVLRADNPPPKYVGRHRAPWYRNRPAATLGLAGFLALFTVACGAGAPSADEPDAAAPPAAEAAAPKGKAPAGFGDGDYEVGTKAGQIAPGTYTTTVGGDSFGCYWARVKSFDGEVDSIIANDNLAEGAKGRVTVKKSDHGVSFTGGCTWTKAAAK